MSVGWLYVRPFYALFRKEPASQSPIHEKSTMTSDGGIDIISRCTTTVTKGPSCGGPLSDDKPQR